MPSWLTEALKVLGFTTPLIYAAATYGVFHWLDKKASGQAKRAISGWLQSGQYDRVAFSNTTIELFDRIYTRQLLSWQAFLRSALITICVTIILQYELSGFSHVLSETREGYSDWYVILFAGTTTIYDHGEYCF
jgi:hypothetical protein